MEQLTVYHEEAHSLMHIEQVEVRQNPCRGVPGVEVGFICRLSGWQQGGILSAAFAGMTEHAAVAETVELVFVLTDPVLWSIESPYLYEAALFLRPDADAPLAETAGLRVGVM